MTDEKQGYCRFCGQAIYDATAATQAEADEKATRECDCSEAERYRAKLKKIEKAKVRLGEMLSPIFGEVSAVEALAKSAVEKVVDKNIRSLSISCDEAIIKIAENAKGNIVLQITKSKTAKVTLDE